MRTLLKSRSKDVALSILKAVAVGLLATGPMSAVGAAEDGPTFDVLVVDKDDHRPIAGAILRAYLDPGEKHFTTGPDGHARLPRPRDENYQLTLDAWADGYQQRRYWFSDNTPKMEPLPENVTVELSEGERTISGTVRNEDGQPIAGVEVELQGMREGETALAFFGIKTTTDARGHWSSRSMPRTLSSIGVWFRHPDYLEPTGGGVKLEKVKDGTEVTTLVRGVPVRGRVLDEQGRPIAGAEIIQPERIGIAVRPPAESDREGRFAFPVASPPDQARTLLAMAPKHAPDLQTITPRVGMADLEFRLGPGQTIRGRAVDSFGGPVADAWVIARNWRNVAWEKILMTTDRDGRFVWDSAPADPVKLDLSARGFEGSPLVVRPVDSEYTWTLKRTLTVEVRVNDAVTGKPIKRFEIEKGKVDKDGKITFEEPKGRQRSVELFGRGYATLDTAAPAGMLRIKAHGYRPLMTRALAADEGRVRLDLTLDRLDFGEGGGPSGIVVGPDGKPLADAEVMLATQSQGASLNGDSWWYGQATLAWSGAGTVMTDADGRFTFLPTEERYSLGAVAPSGYGAIDDKAFAGTHRIEVRPWGRVEGRLLVGGKPAAKVKVRIDDDQPIMTWVALNSGSIVETDGDGRFVAAKVTPGPKEIIASGERFWINRAFGEVPPGGTLPLTIGGVGRPVVGRLVAPGGPDADRDFATSASLGLATDKPQIPYPKDHNHAQQVDWLKSWWWSPEGVAHRHAYIMRGASARPDGSFRFEDVPPGDYLLKAELHETIDGRRRTVATVQHHFQVGPIPNDRTDELLDLGLLGLAKEPISKVLKVGETAPEFEVKTLDGKPLKLADYRGKYVLLDFWATWCGPCVAEFPHLKAVHDRFAKDDRLVMIGLSMDKEAADALKFLEGRKDQPGSIQGFLGEWSADPVSKTFGVDAIPAIFLIGPDGKVVARDLRGEDIAATVGGLLDRN